MPPKDPPDSFATYARVWAVSYLMLAAASLGDSCEGQLLQGFVGFAFLAATVAVLFAASSALLVVAAHVLSLLVFVRRLPGVFDADFWAAHHDLTFVVAAISSGAWRSSSYGRRETVEVAGKLFRIQLSLFYAGAFFWKLNRAFFCQRSSCATVLFMQLLANWLPSAPEWFVRLAARWAPHVTVIVEGGISLLLAIPGRAGRLGIVLGILLHGLIAVTPPPHNIAGYGIRILSRYLLLIPVAANRTERELSDALRGTGPVFQLAIAVATVGATAAVFGTAWPGIEPPVTDWLVPAFVALALFVGRAAYLSKEADEIQTWNRTAPKLTTIVSFEALVFVFGLIFLGLADNFPPKPFSNIRIHGGSNHFFVSTNVLDRTIPSDIVRVEFTSSQHINRLIPAELTHILDSRARNFLQFVGHSGRVFGPAAARAISPDFGAPNGDPFIRYTLPSFELRRLLQEVRQLGEAFTLNYTHLPSYDASSPHLQTSSEVRLVEDGLGGRTCHVVHYNMTTDCPANEPAIQPPPPRWALNMMVFWPNIILDDDQVGRFEGHVGYCFLE